MDASKNIRKFQQVSALICLDGIAAETLFFSVFLLFNKFGK